MYINKKILLTTLALSPVIVLSSCGSSDSNEFSFDYLVNYIKENRLSLVVPKKTLESEVLKYPTKLYLQNPESIDSAFEKSVQLNELIINSNIKVKLEYNLSKNGDSLEFKVTLSQGDKTQEFLDIVNGFITTTKYIGDSTKYLQSLNLTKEHRGKYDLKYFLKYTPYPNFSDGWKKILELNSIPGFTINFQDIETKKYNSKNQYLTIGSFTNIFNNYIEPVKISIENNFTNPTKPLYVFVVDDDGINLDQSTSSIVAEVLFINRTTRNKIKFNHSLAGKGIYGELDFSMFQFWTFPKEIGNGLFKTNNITSVILPSKEINITPEMFLNNKILKFNIPPTIESIFDNSFDKEVIFENLNNNLHLGFQLYYNINDKSLNLKNQNIKSIDELLNLLQLFSHRSDQFVVEKLTLPSSLLNDNIDNNKIISINNLSIKVKEVIFASDENYVDINPSLSFLKWNIETLTIPEHIISINVPTTPKTIKRTLNNKVKQVVSVDGVLDLSTKSPVDGMVLNLDYYYDLGKGNLEKNIVETLYLPNWDTFNTISFNKIFKIVQNKKPTIHISSKTKTWITSALDNINNMNVVREIPENLSGNFINGHLDLSLINGDGIIGDNFFRNIKYLDQEITKITLPLKIVEIPQRAFYKINLSNLSEIKNIGEVVKIQSESFYDSGINSVKYAELNFPKATTIGSNAFYNNQLTSINIPQATTIGSNAFYNNQLTQISVNSKATIENNSFSNNLDLTISEIENIIEGLYDPVNKIVDFSKVTLANKSFKEAMRQLNFLILKDTHIEELKWDLDLTISPNEDNVIGDLNIISITTVNIIGDNISEIPGSLFRDVEIENVIGLGKVGKIGSYAFNNCLIQNFGDKGDKGKLIFDNNLRSIGNYAFQNNKITTLIFKPNVKIDKIPLRSFFDNDIMDIEIPEKISYIDSSAFSPNSWINVKREQSVKSNEWTFNYSTGELHFNKMSMDSIGVELQTSSLNGLKIKKITFDENIYNIPENFLENLQVPTAEIEINLTSILIIDKNDNFPKKIKLLSGSDSNILYNYSKILN